MSQSNPSVVALKDSVDLATLIERTVSHQIESLKSIIASGQDDHPQTTVVFSFGESIRLRLSIGDSRYDMVRITTDKIEGFWNDGVVTGRLNLDQFGNKATIKASVSTNAGGTELGDMTEAQAYVNKGKAIQIVAEALLMSEHNLDLMSQFKHLATLYGQLRDQVDQRREESARARREALRAELSQDPDLIAIEDVDALVESMKEQSSNRPQGIKTLIAFHDGRPTEARGKEALKAIAFFSTSTGKRRLTSQFMGAYERVSGLEREPSSSARNLDKVTLKDLKCILKTQNKIFVSRSLSDPDLIRSL